MDIILDSGAAPILNRIHDSVNHNLRSKGVIAGHGHHTPCHRLSAGCDSVSVAAAADTAGAVVGHLNLDGISAENAVSGR